MTQVFEIFPHVKQGLIVNVMAAHDLAMQGAKASATVILT